MLFTPMQATRLIIDDNFAKEGNQESEEKEGRKRTRHSKVTNSNWDTRRKSRRGLVRNLILDTVCTNGGNKG